MSNGEEIRESVREAYAAVARGEGNCCGPSCRCGSAAELSKKAGYSESEISTTPEGANLGLGCGNPTAIASLKPGEVVLDLGSGAGFDCFLAAERVGPEGRVIGVDMTPDMLEKANRNLEGSGFNNIEFRQGYIEELPVEDNSVDVVISNCVINLSPDKNKVFSEIYRVLKPGGRMMVSDIVKTRRLPDAIENDMATLAACVSGALMEEEYFGAIESAGLAGAKAISKQDYGAALTESPGPVSDLIRSAVPGGDFSGYIASVSVSAVKSGADGCDCGCSC